MEIYVLAVSQQRGVKEVTEWMSKTNGIPVSEICQHRFLLYKPFDEMLSSAGEADVVFTSTASDTPLFLKEHVKTLLPVKEPRLFIDISVPRNVESWVAELDNARVYNVDDLKEVVAANKEDRVRKAMEAQAIITEGAKHFEAWRDSIETVPTIKKLRGYTERIIAAEIEKSLPKLGIEIMNKKMKKTVDDLIRGIVNKLLHGPMQHLRCDGSDSRKLIETLENMQALNRMYGLDAKILGEKIRAKVEKK